MEYVVNPVTGRKIQKYGLVYNRLVENGVFRKNIQRGGNPILAALPTLSQLAIPAGLTLASYYGRKYIGKQQGGGGNMIDNPILQHWITENKIKELDPTTLIPAGIVTAVYNQYANTPNTGKTIYIQISDIVDENDLKTYMKRHKLHSLTPHSYLPFAILMGRDVFKQLLLEDK